MTIAALLWLATGPVQPAPRDAAWAFAYSSYVQRFCPGWTQDLKGMPDDTLPRAETFNTIWGENGVMTLAFREGIRAAEAEHKRDALFCLHPIRSQPAHVALLSRVLHPPAWLKKRAK